jgi:hypothetical protein
MRRRIELAVVVCLIAKVRSNQRGALADEGIPVPGSALGVATGARNPGSNLHLPASRYDQVCCRCPRFRHQLGEEPTAAWVSYACPALSIGLNINFFLRACPKSIAGCLFAFASVGPTSKRLFTASLGRSESWRWRELRVVARVRIFCRREEEEKNSGCGTLKEPIA